MAVPMTVKIPEPITAPIPSEVRLSQPRVFLRRFSGRSASEMSWSMLLVRKSCGSNRHLPRATEENSTLRDPLAQPVLQAAPLRSCDLQVCVTLEKFFGSVILEAHRKPSILAFAFHSDDRADSEFRVSNARTYQGIARCAASRCGTTRFCSAAIGRRPGWRTRVCGSPIRSATAAVRIALRKFRVGLVTTRLSRLGLRAHGGFDQFGGNFPKKTRRKRSPQTVFAICPAIGCARKHQRLLGARHSHIE